MRNFAIFILGIFLCVFLFVKTSHSADLEQFKNYYLEAMDVYEKIDNAAVANNQSERSSLIRSMTELLIKGLEYNPQSPEAYSLICGISDLSPQDKIDACYKAIEFMPFRSDDIDIKSKSWNEEFYIYSMLAGAYGEMELWNEAVSSYEKSLTSKCSYSWNEDMNEICAPMRLISGGNLVYFLNNMYISTKSKEIFEKIQIYIAEMEDIISNRRYLTEDARIEDESFIRTVKEMYAREKMWRQYQVWGIILIGIVVVLIVVGKLFF